MAEQPAYLQLFRQIRRSGWLVFGLQFFLGILLFRDAIFGESVRVFSDLGDGTKNLFTLLSYLRDQPDAWFGYEAMNYPFGESLWYTDATPFVALLFRGLTFFGISPTWLATSGFHVYLLAGIGLSSVFLFRIFERNQVQLWVAWVFCLLLPWISPHLLRLSVGHLNLSLGVFIPGLWYWLMKVEESQGKRIWAWAALATAWIVLASSHHLYFLPMLAFVAGIWMLTSAFRKQLATREKLARVSLSVGIPALSGALIIGWIRLTDPFLSIRPDQALGYNWRGWNLNIDSLVTAYDHLSVPAIPGLRSFLNIETHVYLGGFVIWTMVVALAWVLMNRWIERFPPMHTGDRPAWTTAMLLSGWLCLLLAVGEYARTLGGTLNFDNWLHPFKLIRLVTEDATQFRCLGRFAWPVYWAGAIGSALLWDRMWKGSWGVLKLLFFALWIPLFSDAIGQIRYVQDQLRPNPLETSDLPEIDSDSYDAILPLPYYHVGSETIHLTIDPDTEWEQQCLRASLGLDLPLISNKMSRTAPSQVEQLFAWLRGGSPPADLAGKKILVMFSLAPESWQLSPEDERAGNVLNLGRSMPLREGMKEVGRMRDVVWFEWRIGE